MKDPGWSCSKLTLACLVDVRKEGNGQMLWGQGARAAYVAPWGVCV
jgi:hypothetical protein